MTWHRKTFEQLSAHDLVDIFTLRQNVFIIEQHCIYPDLDGLDSGACHIFKRASSNDYSSPLIAYARILSAGVKCDEWAIGRVIVAKGYRRQGLGMALMNTTIAYIHQQTNTTSIRISAQEHLKGFYEQLNFKGVSLPYDEDGIPHIEMLLPIKTRIRH